MKYKKVHVCPECKKKYYYFHWYINHVINVHKNMRTLEVWRAFIEGVHKEASKRS